MITYKKGFGPSDGESAIESLTEDDLVEQGVGLISKGLFQIEKTKGLDMASREAHAVWSHFREDWLAYMKKMEK